MNFSENFESVKNFAVGAAQSATQKAKDLAAIAKANVSIYAEEDKIRKAEAQLGKLYYRDYAVGEEMDTAEYLPWCQKIDESKKLIAELKDYIDEVKAGEEVSEEAPAACEACDADFEEAPKTEEAAETPAETAEEAPCACEPASCCCEQPKEETSETPEIKIEVVDDEPKAE